MTGNNATNVTNAPLDIRGKGSMRNVLYRVLSVSALRERKAPSAFDSIRVGKTREKRLARYLSESSEVTCETYDGEGSYSRLGSSTKSIPVPFPRSSVQKTRTKRDKMHVSFDQIAVYEHPLILGDHPGVSNGAPTCLDWECQEKFEMTLDTYEKEKGSRTMRSRQEMLLSAHQRSQLLLRAGHSLYEIGHATIQVEEYQRERLEALKQMLSISFGRTLGFVVGGREQRSLLRFSNVVKDVKKGMSLKRQVEIPLPRRKKTSTKGGVDLLDTQTAPITISS